MGAALAANTGAAGAMHRVGFFAAKAAPTGYAHCLRIQFSTRQRSPKDWAISLRGTLWERARPLPQGPAQGDRPVLWAALSRRELNPQTVRVPCGSGFSREESNAVHGTGCAGVRG